MPFNFRASRKFAPTFFAISFSISFTHILFLYIKKIQKIAIFYLIYSKKCHIIKALKNYYSEKMFLYYLLAGIFALAEVAYMGVKRRRVYYFFRLFGREYGSLDFFHTKVLVAPGKLGLVKAKYKFFIRKT